MTLVVRNTFIHYTKEDETSLGCACRSSSAPPSCRAAASGKNDDALSCASTSIEYGSSTPDFDGGQDHGMVPGVDTSSGYETDTGSDCGTMVSFNSDDGSARLAKARNDGMFAPTGQPDLSDLSPEAAQQHLHVMSQTVTQLWSKLSCLEAKLGDAPSPSSTVPPPPPPPATSAPGGSSVGEAASAQQDEKQTIRLAAFLGIDKATTTPTTRTPLVKKGKSSRLDSRAQLFKPSTRSPEVDTVLVSARQILASTPGVLTTDFTPGIVGTIATLSIKLTPNSEDSMYVKIAKVAKAALLDAAACSQSVYILGYEATPFEDNPYGPSFSAALAVAPAAWECTACWETYQQGVCPRGSTCRWQHPGRDEIQPIRVVFH